MKNKLYFPLFFLISGDLEVVGSEQGWICESGQEDVW